jgi:hypothetical protein
MQEKRAIVARFVSFNGSGPIHPLGVVIDSVHIRNEREAGRLEHLFEGTVAFSQYASRGMAVAPLEPLNSAAALRT